MKRLISLVLVLVMCLGLFSMTVSASDMPFTDVKPTAYYATAVQWAVENNITSGLSATKFGPDETCTRGQVVTFLWRACGKPEPTKTTHNFTDVKSSAFYYKAMLWAVETGVTSGISSTKFAPDQDCTRGQVVTFLHRAAGKPAPTQTSHNFTDVKSSAFYYKAMLWAVENNITKGTSSTKFSPEDTCTRGQVVTFLYRAKDYMNPQTAKLTIATQPEDYYIFTGVANFTVAASGGDGTYAYQWQYKKDGMSDFANVTSSLSWAKNYTSATLNINSIPVAEVSKNYQFRCVISDGTGAKITSDAAKLIRKTALAISEQPKDVTGSVGDEATFTVAATGGKPPYTYQWYLKAASGQWIESTVNSATYKFEVNTVTVTQNYSFYCVVTDDEGSKVTSETARLYGPLSIKTDPEDKTVALNGTATFRVEATGGKQNYSYQWKVKMPGMRSYMNVESYAGLNAILGEDGALTVTAYTIDLNGALFRCVVTDANGASATSTDGKLKVVDGAPTFTLQPKDQYVSSGMAEFEVAVTGGKAPYTYQWQEREYGGRGTTYENITGGMFGYNGYNTCGLAVDVEANNAYNYEYRCVVTDANGVSVISDVATICKPLVITTQPVDIDIIRLNEYGAITIEVDGGKEPYEYAWQIQTNTGWSDLTESMVVKPKGLGTATLEVLIPVEGLFGQVKFRCVVSDSNGENVISNYVTVYRGVYAHLNSYDSTLGRLDMYEHLSVTASGGVEPYSYFWYCWVAGGTQELISTEKSCKVVWKSAGTTQYLKCVVMDARGKTYEVDGIIMYSDRY